MNGPQDCVDEIRQRFAEISYPAQPMDLSCTFSCGIAELHDGVDSKALSKRADEALYKAKAAGRNRVVGPADATGEGAAAARRSRNASAAAARASAAGTRD